MYGAKTRSIVSCDTAPRTPAGNKEAWEDRIRLAFGSSEGADANRDAYARYIGMGKLARVTVPRWFPEGSLCHPDSTAGGVNGTELHNSSNRIPNWVKGMIEKTDPDGFLHGARALGSYDVLDLAQEDKQHTKRLYDSQVEKVLLLAGTLDGGGKVCAGLKALSEGWNRMLGASTTAGPDNDASSSPSLGRVKFVGLEKAGHLPMIDSSEAFCEAVAWFFNSM